MQIEEITVQQLHSKMENGSEPVIVDVREPHELKISSIPAISIPLAELVTRYEELYDYKNDEIVVICRSGSRSAQACFYLQNKGFGNVKNLRGGINEWAREIDTSLPTY
ncbi:MAG TPA: rhodanese-like domain-containing protein [Balneolales bacterium]|nr:rhodanese-like domain-containing protein [Balneolales bacterium]